MTVEILCIALQAARGTTSHYKLATVFDAVVFNTMGLGILGNTALAGWLLALYLRRVPLPLAYLWGIRLGLLVFVLGSLEGAAMLLRGAHTVGAPDGGAGLPFVNWSTQARDLRVAHALGLHAIQVLRLAGHVISRRFGAASAARQLTGLFLFAAAYGGLGAYLFWTAIHGRPVIPS